MLFNVFFVLCVSFSTVYCQIDVKVENKTYNGTYLIVAPKVVRAGLPYSVVVNILKNLEPVTVTISILNSNNESLGEASQKDISAGKPVTVKIDKVSTANGINYRIRAKGVERSGNILFDQSSPLNFNAKSLSIFIQTDKAIFKPGSAVHFRVIVVTPDLKPFKGLADIKITDPNRNVIEHFANQTIDTGIVGKQDKLKFQLIEEPPLGQWKISAVVGTQKVEKYFTVDKYVLPKFDVNVKTPAYLTKGDDAVITVSSKYTYGKGVAGSVTLIAESPYVWEKRIPISKSTEASANGETTFRFPYSSFRENKIINDYGVQNVKLTATVTEGLTGIQRNGTGFVTFYTVPYTISIDLPASTFKTGMDFNIIVSVKTPDGRPLSPNVTDRSVNMTILYRRPNDFLSPELKRSEPIIKILKLDSEGTASFVIVPSGNATNIDIEARYANSTVMTSRYVQANLSPTNSYLQIVASDKSVTAGKVAQLTVKTTENVGTLTAQVMSRGYMVFSSEVKATGNTVELKIPTTHEMAPKARIIVYAIRADNKEILVDAMDIVVDGLFTNNVSIEVDHDKAEPNNTVTFKVKASPNSYVGLLSVDQSVLLLKSGNDISPDLVQSDIASYGSGSSNWGSFPWGGRGKRSVCFRCGFFWISGKDAYSIFENSGVSVITDAYLYREPIPNYRRLLGGGAGFGVGSGAKAAALGDRNSLKKEAQVPESSAVSGQAANPVVRRLFPETWIWTDALTKDFSSDFGFGGVGLAPGAAGGRGIPGPALPGALPPPPPPPPPSPSNSPEPAVRKSFPETWIWADSVVNNNGEATYSAQVPDTITSWITSAFAVHETDGLGVGPETAKVEVFRPFFISLNLPYSVKRGEKLALQVLVFNYMKTEQTVTITIDHSDHSGFDFVEKPGTTKDTKSKDPTKRQIKVIADGSASVHFPILPTIVGDIKFLVKAYGQGVSDAVEQPLFVEAEGFPLFRNKPLIVDLSSKESWSNSVQLDIPTDAVNGSQKAYVSVFGDMLGSALNNIDSLIQMPYGCGEQNMLGFVPNIVVARYLKATSRLTPELEAKTKQYMQSGYQREMTYQRDDASYSAFGKTDKAGSTWLSAFVARSFQQAKPFVYIDNDKLKQTLAFLKTQQKENGLFSESGTVHHKDMQGGSGQGGAPLTAYVLLALLENDEKNEKAVDYLERNLDRIGNDSYALSIVSYALHLANSAKKDAAFKLLEDQAVEKDGLKYWTKVISTADGEKQPSYWDRPKPVDVEMTSYAMQTYLLRNEIEKSLPLFRWLTSQQNQNGGYSSTQDTVMAIQAIGAYAEKTYSDKVDVEMNVETDSKKHTFKVNKENSIIQQTFEIKQFDKPIKLSAKGKGQVFTQVNYHYNMLQLDNRKPFTCDQDVSQDKSKNVKLSLCCQYNLKGRSNMAVMEISSPSGYGFDEYELNQLKSTVKDLTRVEFEAGNTKTNIYFNSMGSEPTCFNVTANFNYFVADQKPSLIKLYDYYSPSLRFDTEYSLKQKLSLQDVCGTGCWD